MIEELPTPPVPADLDLTKLEYMPLLVARLMRSKAWKMAKQYPPLGFYLMNLWMAAWTAKPAASLDDDEIELCDAAKCSAAEWPEVRERALHGFAKHSDGRLYHHVIVEQALEAHGKRFKWADKKRKQRAATAPQVSLFGDDEGQSTLSPGTDIENDDVSPGTTTNVPRDEPLRYETVRDVTPTRDKSLVGARNRAAHPKPVFMGSDLTMPEAWRSWAAKKRADLDPDAVFEAFKAHYANQEKNDWEPTWRRWVTAETVKPHNRAKPKPSTVDPEAVWKSLGWHVRNGIAPRVPLTEAMTPEIINRGLASLQQCADYFRVTVETLADRCGIELEQPESDNVSRENCGTAATADVLQLPEQPESPGPTSLPSMQDGVHAPMAFETAAGTSTAQTFGNPKPHIDIDAELAATIPAFLRAPRSVAA